ncbi:glycoside hydrolase superfamily [Zopfochytrium polystomum]|nr:glycoside hydrolase superfamily [Zopfochytrium polystomum]
MKADPTMMERQGRDRSSSSRITNISNTSNKTAAAAQPRRRPSRPHQQQQQQQQQLRHASPITITITIVMATAASVALALALVLSIAVPSAAAPQRTTSTTTTSYPLTFIFGPWLNTGEQPTDVDSPAQWNKRTGRNAPAFQLRMSVPAWSGEPQVLQVADWDDGTDAAVFMTVYADSPAYVWPTEADLTVMAQKLQNISTSTGRTVYLRYLPEMDGSWMNYGAQPTELVANWKIMASVVRSVAPDVQIVWSPNFDVQNRGGAAFWPGEENVDWVGTSQYWKSSQMGYPGNAPVTAGYFAKEIDYVYQNFAVVYNKPFVLSEASYAWEEALQGNFTDTVSWVDAQKEYWRQVFDTASSGAYPLFKMAYVFEYKKIEDSMYRDFRVSWNSAVLDGFQTTLESLIAAGNLATAGDWIAQKVLVVVVRRPRRLRSTSSSTAVPTTSAPVSTKSAAAGPRWAGWKELFATVALVAVSVSAVVLA